MPWNHRAKIAFIGSHGVRKTTAAHGFIVTLARAGRSAEIVKEVVRYNPLGLNENATPESQLWVIAAQVKAEIELSGRADVLVCDRSVVDNYAYALRANGGRELYGIEAFLLSWAPTYDLFVRLLPDVALAADGVRSTNDDFRNEIEHILDEILPRFLPESRLITLPASSVTRHFDWWPIAERLADEIGESLED